MRLIIGLDFSVTRSSPESCCDLFDISSEQLVELKWLILNKHNKWFHSSRVKFPLVRISASWFLVSMYLIWIVGPSWFDRTTKQAQLCGFWKRVSLWDSFPLRSSWSLLRCPQTETTKLLDAKTGRLREHSQYYSARLSFLEIFVPCHWQRVFQVFQESESCFQGLKRADPTNRERESRPISIQRPKRWFRILLNSAKLQFVSYTSNLLEQMYDFKKCTMFLQRWILNPQDLLQNRSLETVPACIVLQCHPHNNTVCIHMCDECKMSIDSGVCPKLWAYSLTIEYRVFQSVPSISISEQFESILVTILQQISFLLLWNNSHHCME